MRSNPRRNAGWAGLIVLLVVVAIIGLLGKTLLQQMFGRDLNTDLKGPRGPGPAATLADPDPAGSNVPSPAAQINRATNLGNAMQQQAQEQFKRMDAIEGK
jgi:hypothetical protein